MDQLTAYKILGLEPDCLPEEIKEAYATLSKQFHPEEEPEKFQEIHEAYITLTRRKRRGSVEVTEWKDTQPESNFEYNFKKAQEQRDERNKTEFAFDAAMQKAQQQAEEKLHELVLEAAAELKVLTSPKYNSNLKAYKTFFEDKKYELVIKKTEFLEKLCDVLEQTKLQKNIYNYMIEFYRLRGMKPNELSSIGLRLYQVLDEKAGVEKKVHPGLYGGVVVGLICAFRVLRPLIRQSEVLTTIVLSTFAVLILVWVLKKLIERRSALLVQAVVSAGLMISQFLVIMFDAYGTFFGTVDDGNSVAAVIFLLGSAWLLVVIVVAIIKVVVKHIFNK